ncbi:MAG TPA: hypothetical protein VMX75_03875 [Spirochaetia bacterium]|nr:hypothetical protein [Spirochaetia bacterium]
MKGLKVVLFLIFLSTSLMTFSQTLLTDSFNNLSNWAAVSGNWKVMNGRVVQTDMNQKMAMLTARVPQSGKILIEFDVEYVGGGEDDYAGFGFHICVDNPSKSRSWGNGKSLLGWVTWDPNVYGWPGAFIQVYQSKGPVEMGLYPQGNILKDGDQYPVKEEYLKYEYLNYNIPIKMMIDTKTGMGRFYDPFDPERFFYSFDLGAPIPAGNNFTFRMNSVSLSIDNLKISKVQ